MAKTYEVPSEVRNAAKKGLKLHEQHGRGGTEVGVAMARKLSSGDKMSEEDVLHVSKYFPRHAGDNLDERGDDPSNGYIAWMLWGGDAGRKWSEKIKEELEGANA
jgi:hypothetical protein